MVGFLLVKMAEDLSNSRKKEDTIFRECKWHNDTGFDETDRRAHGKNRIGSISFDEADELFRSWLDENKWPYDALIFDPRVFTFIFEKTSRLIANKPKGKLVPREGSDAVAAKINNELLSYQWDLATVGGTMLSKWALMDINARKYGASFGLSKWRYEVDGDDRVVFDGPEFQVLNNRDIAHDLSATSIENCNWFLVRQYVTVQELQRVNDNARSKPIYKNLDKLKFAISRDDQQAVGNGGDTRSVNWISRNRAISGLETDPIGKDPSNKTIEIVTEYRKDRWITFAPRHGVILRDIPNPYKNNELPIVLLRYYQIDDDLYGVSEIEPIKGIQKGINALLCQYVDEINQHLYSPIAVGPGVRQHTLEWGKGARWIMNNPMTDFRLVESRSNAAQYFNNTYSVLVASMMNALGESSLGVSNTQPYSQGKTATEVKALQLQRNARDNFNQLFLSEAIKRQYLLWHSMNQVLLFSDPKKKNYIFRIVGRDLLQEFQQSQLDVMQIDDTAIQGEQAIAEAYPDLADTKAQGAMLPKYPVRVGKEIVPKLRVDENGLSGQLVVEPEDIKGQFDFSIDVESMAVSADEEKKQARQLAIQTLTTNPNVFQMLMTEGYKPKFKELLVSWLEDLGFSDANRFFEKDQTQQAAQAGAAGGGNPLASIMSAMGGGQPQGGGAPTTGIPGGTNPNQGGEAPRVSPFAPPMANVPNAGLGPISPKALGE